MIGTHRKSVQKKLFKELQKSVYSSVSYNRCFCLFVTYAGNEKTQYTHMQCTNVHITITHNFSTSPFLWLINTIITDEYSKDMSQALKGYHDSMDKLDPWYRCLTDKTCTVQTFWRFHSHDWMHSFYPAHAHVHTLIQTHSNTVQVTINGTL